MDPWTGTDNSTRHSQADTAPRRTYIHSVFWLDSHPPIFTFLGEGIYTRGRNTESTDYQPPSLSNIDGTTISIIPFFDPTRFRRHTLSYYNRSGDRECPSLVLSHPCPTFPRFFSLFLLVSYPPPHSTYVLTTTDYIDPPPSIDGLGTGGDTGKTGYITIIAH